MKTQALWYQPPGNAGIIASQLKSRKAGEVRVRNLFSGISRGTERLVYNGRLAQSQFSTMRAPFQEGDFPGPVKYGYQSVGVIVDGSDSDVGRTVFCLHPHQTCYDIARDQVVDIPLGVPARRAVLAANCETALNGIWDAGTVPGMRVAVVGAGVIGLLIARLVSAIPATSVIVIDVDQNKQIYARELGVHFAQPDAAGGFDQVFHCSGSAQGLQSAIDLAGAEATVVEMSWYGDHSTSLALGGNFHSGRLRIISSQVGMVAPVMRSRWSRRGRLCMAISLLDDPVFDMLLNSSSDFAHLPECLQALFSDQSGVLCHLVKY